VNWLILKITRCFQKNELVAQSSVHLPRAFTNRFAKAPLVKFCPPLLKTDIENIYHNLNFRK